MLNFYAEGNIEYEKNLKKILQEKKSIQKENGSIKIKTEIQLLKSKIKKLLYLNSLMSDKN